ncbi:MAG: hypothetical protein HYT30_01145 [Parcubacteria group bacterium]|nr:hypothetical protein [Parcubacteria group bacterium]
MHAIAKGSEVPDRDDPRFEERTFATFPEWYIVYSAQEYADFVARGGLPSRFPYIGAIRQFWDSIRYMKANIASHPIDSESETVLNVIGWSFTVEYGLIGIYENTVGRLTEILHGNSVLPPFL